MGLPSHGQHRLSEHVLHEGRCRADAVKEGEDDDFLVPSAPANGWKDCDRSPLALESDSDGAPRCPCACAGGHLGDRRLGGHVPGLGPPGATPSAGFVPTVASLGPGRRPAENRRGDAEPESSYGICVSSTVVPAHKNVLRHNA